MVMDKVILPFAKSIDEITQTGFYTTPDGIAQVTIYPHKHLPCVKEYRLCERGVAGIITEDGRHYTRRHVDGSWTAWELMK